MAANRASKIIINGHEMDYTPFEWPFYRGHEARPVVFAQGAQKGLLYRDALSYSDNTIEVISPKRAGGGSEVDRIVLSKVFADRDVVHNDEQHTVTLFDARFAISRFTSPFRFNVKQGDVYQKDTAISKTKPATLEFAIEKFEQLTSLKFDMNDATGDVALPDELSTEGKKAHVALGEVLESVGHDLTVSAIGSLHIIGRSQANSGSIQSLHKYAWRKTPGFLFDNAKKHSAPETIVVPYTERHEIKIVNEDYDIRQGGASRKTIGRRRDKDNKPVLVPAFEMEQVYKWEGKYLNLAELNDVIRKSILTARSFTDNTIADSFMSRNWERTLLEQQLTDGFKSLSSTEQVSEERRRLLALPMVKVITEDWRRLWRLKLDDEFDNTWGDISFGAMNKDGSVTSGSVEVPWVDFLSAPLVKRNSLGGKVFIMKTQFNQNHGFGPAPFVPVWEDKAHRILRLRAEGAREGMLGRMPGTLFNNITLERVKVDDDKDVDGKTGKEFKKSALKTTRDRAKFDHGLSLRISVIATKQAPNSTDKWTTFRHKTDIKGAAAGELWTTVDSSVTANYLFVDEKKPANNKDLEAASLKRAGAVIAEYDIVREGTAEALGTLLAQEETPISGAVESITVNFGNETKAYVSTSIVIKNFADSSIRSQEQQKRQLKTFTGKGRKTK